MTRQRWLGTSEFHIIPGYIMLLSSRYYSLFRRPFVLLLLLFVIRYTNPNFSRK